MVRSLGAGGAGGAGRGGRAPSVSQIQNTFKKGNRISSLPAANNDSHNGMLPSTMILLSVKFSAS